MSTRHGASPDRHPYRGRAMRCCVLLSRAHASLCVSPLALEQRNAQGTWRLICHNCRLTKLDKNATVRQTTHVERRRSCVCSKRCSVRLCGDRGTGRYRRPTLAPDKDQRRGASDAFVAWLSACREIGAPMQGVLRSWPCRSTPEDVCQGRRRGSKRGKDADPDGILQAELFSQGDVAVRDAMARCGATGSKLVTGWRTSEGTLRRVSHARSHEHGRGRHADAMRGWQARVVSAHHIGGRGDPATMQR